MNKFLSIFVFLTTLPLSAQALLFGGFGGGTSSKLIDEDEQTAAIPYPDYGAEHKVYGAKISPDGKWFATEAEEKVEGKDVATLRIWNSETKKKLASHRPVPMGGINGFEFLPDGTGYLLAKPGPQSADEAKGYRFNKAVVWNMDRTIRRRLTWDGDFNWGCGVAIHPDNQQAAICVQKLPVKNDGALDGDFIFPRMERGTLSPYVNSRILLLNIKDGEQINLSGQLTLPKSMPGKLLGYSPDGQTLAFKRMGHHKLEGALDDKTVVLLNSSSLTTSYTSDPHQSPLAFSPDSSLAYSASSPSCGKADKGKAKGKYECRSQVSAKPLQDGKLVDEPAPEIKDLSYQWSQYDSENVIAAGSHGLVYAGDTVLLHVTEPGNGGFFQKVFTASLKSKGRRLFAARFLPDGSAIRFVTSDDTKSIPLKSSAELQQLAAQARNWRKACALFEESIKLAKLGMYELMADKFRAGLALEPIPDGCRIADATGTALWAQQQGASDVPFALMGQLQLEAIKAMTARPKRARLGIEFKDDSLLIEDYYQGDQAVDILAGDRVLKVAGRPVATLEDVDQVRGAHQIGEKIVVEIERNGRSMSREIVLKAAYVQSTLGYVMLSWGSYANAASFVRQPGLVMMAVEEMRKLIRTYPWEFNIKTNKKPPVYATAYEALALAGMGKEAEAFTLLGRQEALKDIYGFVFYDDFKLTALGWWPLLASPDKLAYLIGREASQLPKLSSMPRPTSQPFPDPTGRIINPPGRAVDAVVPAPTFSGGVSGGSSAPSPTPADGATILE